MLGDLSLNVQRHERGRKSEEGLLEVSLVCPTFLFIRLGSISGTEFPAVCEGFRMVTGEPCGLPIHSAITAFRQIDGARIMG
jgi:hypothetical protein